MVMRSSLLLATLAAMAAMPAAAATFDELLAWCGPPDRGGRHFLCDGYLNAGLELLASPDPMINGGTPACVPVSEDRGRIIALLQDYARRHHASRSLSGADGLGMALKDHFPCR
jgi:hypothetical protein